MSNIGIIGFGDLGMQIFLFLKEEGVSEDNVLFFDDIAYEDKMKNSRPFSMYRDDEYRNIEFYVALGYKHLKLKHDIIEELLGLNRRLPSFVHKTAYIHPTAKLHSGVVVYPKACIDQNVELERGVLINNNVVISHNTKIGYSTFVAPSVSVAGKCNIGEKCFLGIGSVVIDNVIVWGNIQIGAGAVVVNNLKIEGCYVGIPAKKI